MGRLGQWGIGTASRAPYPSPAHCPLPSTLTELDKHILGFIKCHLLEILAHEGLDRMLVPVRGDLLAQEIGLGKTGQTLWDLS